MRKLPANSIADEDRCKKNVGYGWRCPFPLFAGSSRYCEKHHFYYLNRKRSRVSDSTQKRVMVSDASEIRKEGGGGRDRTDVRVLQLGEIWAFSGESDGFPRSYARIDRIILDQSLAQVTPLVPLMSFAEQDISLACGLFRASESILIKEISAFTHKVVFEIEGKGSSFYKIFPKKGEIWAVYWKWDDSEKSVEYKLVEVVSDFGEEDGVVVLGLVQVEDKNGVYRRHGIEGFYQLRSFPLTHISMFSHRVLAERIAEGSDTFWRVMFH